MKQKVKKYPLLICLIVSVAIIVASLFVIGFAGLKFDTTLVGGSQVEVVLPDDADSQDYANSARVICKQTGLSLYSVIVEDKFTAGDENGEYTKRVMILTFAERDVEEEKQTQYREALAEKLGFENADDISEFKVVTNMVESKNIWFVALSIGIVVVCAFVFAWIRYDIFAAISLLVSYLHMVIMFFAISSLTRVPIGLTSLAIMVVLMFITSAVLIHMFEEYRKSARLHIDDKQTITAKLIAAQKNSFIPYLGIASVVVIVSLLLMLSPSFMVRLTAISCVLALIVCAYTAMLITPGLYAYLLDLGKTSEANRLSRNDTKNKAIKKKIATSAKAVSEKKSSTAKDSADEAKTIKSSKSSSGSKTTKTAKKEEK